MDNAFEAANQLLDAGEPIAWMWDENGRRVVGKVVNAFTRDTQYQEDCPVLVLEIDDTGTQVAVWGTGVLTDKFRQLEKQGLTIGDTVGVERGEVKAKSGTGREYWPFQVVRIPGPNAAATKGMFGAGTDPAALEAGEAVEVTAEGDDW